MSLNLRPTTRAVPIDRTGPPACATTLHRHCEKCGTADATVAQTRPVNGVPWPALCSTCTAKAFRVRAVVKAVAALEGGCD